MEDHYIGIDLGTTNSAICTYNKETPQTRVWKSPENNDVTPSAIYIDRRGSQFIGQTAYNAAPRSPDNCATLFKRFMGTTETIALPAVNRTLTPEECSAEILKTLFGYLPEEIRNSPDIGTVITVPAAFDQMKKNATMEAAKMADIGRVELVQEPVAAVMSFMKTHKTDGIFLIYDLGGGTLDITVAESIRRRVNLLANGGIPMCGGRDFDRALVDNLVRPWLHDNFDLPDDLATNPKFKKLLSLATWATERAKIELSAKHEATISLDEVDIGIEDLNGEEIYLDISLQRDFYNDLIADRINDTIHAARETLSNTGYTANDVECIVWVGGPTHYKPLRDKVSFELGIKGDILAVNPMTAVAEGASIFAESIRWEEESSPNYTSEEQPSDAGILSSGAPLITFNFNPETPDDTSRIAVKVEGQVPVGYAFEIQSLDDAWTSGRIPVRHGEIVNVNLRKPGDNTFEAVVYDAAGKSIKQDEIVITQRDVIVEGIPASNILLEVVEKIGGRSVPLYLAEEHDTLPKEGTKPLIALESVEAGSDKSLNFKLWEGKIHDIVSDNRPISHLQIKGHDFAEGTIPENAELKCSYEITSGGNITFEVEVELGGTPKKFDLAKVYDYKKEKSSPPAFRVAEEGIQIQKRINHINEIVGSNQKLERAEQTIEPALTLSREETDAETILGAHNATLEAKILLFQVREENRKEIRQSNLNNAVADFNMYSRQHARPSEETAFDNLVETAQRAIDNNDDDFNEHLGELRGRDFEILWGQDWFVIDMFKHLVTLSPDESVDPDRFEMLVDIGNQLLEHPEIREILAGRREATIRSEAVDQLRGVVAQIMSILRNQDRPNIGRNR